MSAGVHVGGAPVDADAPLVVELKYETVFIDIDHPSWKRPPDPLPLFFVNTLIFSTAAANAPIATRGNRRFVDRSQVPAPHVGEERYAVGERRHTRRNTRRRRKQPLARHTPTSSLPTTFRAPGPRPTRGRARIEMPG